LQQFVVEVVNCVLVCFELFHVFHVACELLWWLVASKLLLDLVENGVEI
jgi:hypothetical protein